MKSTTLSGSISVALYLHDLPVRRAVATHLEQGVIALEDGFDGVTVSEHHAGFSGYFPTPMLAAARILGATKRGWVAACPLLLPLRNPALVAEEVAWLGAMYPGRVAAGFAAGYAAQDFDALDIPRQGANREFRTRLRKLRALGSPGGELADDPAVRSFLGATPLLVCTGGILGAQSAAQLGMGLLLPPQDVERSIGAVEAYLAAGGRGPRVGSQWVWLGMPPRTGIEALRRAYPPIDSQGNRAYTPTVAVGKSASDVADLLSEQIERLSLTSLNLRVHLPNVGPAETSEQLRHVASELIPLLRPKLAQT